ncbi:hypothetical protein BTR23_25240 [Alkalihalophilus pseudofirmus]|nr:hypothetical protein BTR23_25240 [Alkalihalophilus pseudofirmus]
MISKILNINGQLIFSFILLFLVISMVLMTGNYVGGAKLFPQIVGVAVGFLIVVDITRQILISRKMKKTTTNEAETKTINIKLIIILCALPIYYFLIKFLGYLLASAVVVLVVPFLLGMRNIKLVLITSTIIWLLVYLLFSVLLNVPFPKGVFG